MFTKASHRVGSDKRGLTSRTRMNAFQESAFKEANEPSPRRVFETETEAVAH